MATIYLIHSEKGNKVYVGSTADLKDRMRRHPYRNGCTSSILFDEYGIDNCIFTVLEECDADKRLIQERYWLEQYATTAVNKKRPVITKEEDYQRRKESGKQWRKDNPEKQKEIDRRRYEKNRERRLQYQKEYYQRMRALKHDEENSEVIVRDDLRTDTGIVSTR